MTIRPSKLQKLLALSGSSNEGEATNAATMLARGLREGKVNLERALTRRGAESDDTAALLYKSKYKSACQLMQTMALRISQMESQIALQKAELQRYQHKEEAAFKAAHKKYWEEQRRAAAEERTKKKKGIWEW